jgi:hypothetical protein
MLKPRGWTAVQRRQTAGHKQSCFGVMTKELRRQQQPSGQTHSLASYRNFDRLPVGAARLENERSDQSQNSGLCGTTGFIQLTKQVWNLSEVIKS